MDFSVPIGDARLFPDALACPLCGERYLHQGAIEVFHRRKEDADPVVTVVVDGCAIDVTGTPGAGVRNPSSRRQGLLIQFDCEHCHLLQSGIVLAIWQHKGRTFIEWRNAAEEAQRRRPAETVLFEPGW